MPKVFFLFFILSLSSPSFAEVEKQGRITLFGSSMPAQMEKEAGASQAGLESNLDLNLKGERISFRLQPWFKYDSFNKSREEKFQFEFLEAQLNWKKNSNQSKIGLSTVNWEGTDFLNPMDMLNAKNYRDPMNIMTRSSGMINFSSQGQKWGIDVVYVPWRSRDLLPGDNSPWWPRYLALPTENEETHFLIPEQVHYDLNEHQILDDALRHNAGMKIQYSGDQWDFAVAGSEGAASPLLLHPIANATIVVAPAKVIQLQNPVHIQPVYYRSRNFAFYFSKAWETLILRFSGQHSQPIGENKVISAMSQSGLRDINIKLPTWTEFGVIELEKHFSILENDFTLIFEYAQSKKPDSNGVSSFSSALQNVYLIGFRWPFSETWTWNAAFFQDYKTKANYSHSGLNKNWNDHFSSELSFDLFSGADDSLLGVYDKNDQVSLKTSFAF